MKMWNSREFASSFNTKSTLINNNILFYIYFISTKKTIDHIGRFVFLEGHMYSEFWSVMNILAPNFDDPVLQNTFLHTAQASGVLLIGGDFHFYPDTVLDRSSDEQLSLTKGSKLTNAFMTDYNLTDVWMWLHPGYRDYILFIQIFMAPTQV